MADAKIDVPAVPAGLPAAVQKKWTAAYIESFKEAQNDFPEDPVMQKQVALRDANRLLRTPEPANYDDAMKLEDWHVIHREPTENGKELKVVTRHGKKYRFPIPEKAQKPTPAA